MSYSNKKFQQQNKPDFSQDHNSTLPAGYLKNGYFDDKGNILPEAIIDWPKDIAQKLDRARPEIKTAQLRKFFSETRRIEGQLKAGKAFDTLRGRILKLDSYAADALKKIMCHLFLKNLSKPI